MKNSTWLSRGITLLSLLFFFGIWQFGASFYHAVLVPSPGETLQALGKLMHSGKLWQYILETIGRGLLGFSLAVLVGTPLGLFMGLQQPLRWFIQPMIIIVQVIPIISWLVLAMIWFGTDRVPVFVVFITTLPLIIINIVQGVMQMDHRLTQMAKLFQVEPRSLMLEVYLPQVLPYLFAAMSSALGTTWKAVAMAEFLSAQRGIGAGMAVSRINLETAEVFAWTLLLVLLGLLTDHGLRQINKRLSGWRMPY